MLPRFNDMEGDYMKDKIFSKIKAEMLRKLREENLVAPKEVGDTTQKILVPSDDVEMMSAEEFFGNLDD